MIINCSVEGCGKPVKARGWCAMHWNRWKRHGDPSLGARTVHACSVDGCEVRSRARGLCRKHWMRWRRHGDPLTVHKPPGRPRKHPKEKETA
jgi:hypothetical protein